MAISLKGQNFRILTYDTVASKFKCVGMATNCTVNLTANTDDASTKDDIGGAQKPTVTNKRWQVSVESLSVADIAAILTAIKGYQKFTLLWDEVSTVDNQLPLQAGFARTGSAYLNDVTFNFNDRENASKSLQFTGVGQLAKITDTPAFEEITPSSQQHLHQGSVRASLPRKRQHRHPCKGHCIRQEPVAPRLAVSRRRDDQGHRWQLAGTRADWHLLRHQLQRSRAFW